MAAMTDQKEVWRKEPHDEGHSYLVTEVNGHEMERALMYSETVDEILRSREAAELLEEIVVNSTHHKMDAIAEGMEDVRSILIIGNPALRDRLRSWGERRKGG